MWGFFILLIIGLGVLAALYLRHRRAAANSVARWNEPHGRYCSYPVYRKKAGW